MSEETVGSIFIEDEELTLLDACGG